MTWMRIGELAEENPDAIVVVDTAPTGHTLRMLGSAEHFKQFAAALDAMQEKHRGIVRQFARRNVRDAMDVFIADFEDATSPTWGNHVGGQANLMDAVRRTISYAAPETGKQYALRPPLETLMVRPRGFHLRERHVIIDGQPVPGMLFDFGLYLFHNAAALKAAAVSVVK